MGSKKEDKWIESLKDSLQDYSEQLPDNFWEKLQNDIPAHMPEVAPQKKRRWPQFAASAVAVLLIVLFIVWNNEDLPKLAQADVPEILLPHSGHELQSLDLSVTSSCEEGIRQELAIVESAFGMSYAEDVAPQDIPDKVIVLDATGEVRPEVEDAEADAVADADAVAGGKEVNHREEYLKELEYLLQEDENKKGNGKKWLAMAAGSGGGIPDFSQGDRFSSILLDVSNDPTGTNMVANMVNLDRLSSTGSKVGWIGERVPNFANNPVQKTKYLEYDHKMPVRVGISFAYGINERLYVESGIMYQYLESTIIVMGKQRLHYVGVPVKMSYHFAKGRAMSAYASGGLLIEKCVYGEILGSDGSRESLEIGGVEPSVLFSFGAQINLGGNAALYIEPGVHYYTGMDNDGVLVNHRGYQIKSVYSENPFGVSLQGGVKFSF